MREKITNPHDISNIQCVTERNKNEPKHGMSSIRRFLARRIPPSMQFPLHPNSHFETLLNRQQINFT